MKKIGILTCGGDAPGMNAAIRAVVRTAVYLGWEVIGIERGFSGLISNKFLRLDSSSVSGIINKGGTILYSVRCPEFKEKDGIKKAIKNIRKENIEGLIVIGGDGSLKGAYALQKKGIPVIFIPASIDNDIFGTEETIGFDSAVNTALGAIDKIRDTATSHERIFLIEVMGRESGFLALEVGLAAGAEAILIPEVKFKMEDICDILKKGRKRGKRSYIIIVAEGAGEASEIGKEIGKRVKGEIRVTTLGYLQRGGAPSADSRNLALQFGAFAVKLLKNEESGKMVGINKGKVVPIPMEKIYRRRKRIDLRRYQLAKILSL
ncbi:MAG: 6-phosphofructokinase [Candidatus Omnitrophica bacterium]|nr:6-phosphofructokinase [Candidatus Omnitrophota bacterium]